MTGLLALVEYTVATCADETLGFTTSPLCSRLGVPSGTPIEVIPGGFCEGRYSIKPDLRQEFTQMFASPSLEFYGAFETAVHPFGPDSPRPDYTVLFLPVADEITIQYRSAHLRDGRIVAVAGGCLNLLPPERWSGRWIIRPEAATLDSFMLARIRGVDDAALALTEESFRAEIVSGAIDPSVPALQPINPCWYRYEVESFASHADGTSASATVRVYEHFWSGDEGGGPPASWAQAVSLSLTPFGWRVVSLGTPSAEREEPGEPHGPTLSACST